MKIPLFFFHYNVLFSHFSFSVRWCWCVFLSFSSLFISSWLDQSCGNFNFDKQHAHTAHTHMSKKTVRFTLKCMWFYAHLFLYIRFRLWWWFRWWWQYIPWKWYTRSDILHDKSIVQNYCAFFIKMAAVKKAENYFSFIYHFLVFLPSMQGIHMNLLYIVLKMCAFTCFTVDFDFSVSFSRLLAWFSF